MGLSIHRNLKYILLSLLIFCLLSIVLVNRSLLAQQNTTQSPIPTPLLRSPLDAVTAAPQEATVAYIQEGDLWVKTLPDGEPQRLTENGTNNSPRWSPSGESLSFLMDSPYPNIRTVGYGGGAATSYGGPVQDAYAWSPVGVQLAYGINGEIWVSGMPLVQSVDFTSSESTKGEIGKLAWSPDGQQIAFTLTTQQGDGGLAEDGLWVVDAYNGQPVRVLEGTMPETGGIILHGWSGDGKYLLYWQAPILSASILSDGVPLYALPLDGGEPVMVAEAVLVHDDAVQALRGSDQIAVVVGSGREVWTNKSLHLFSLDAMQESALAKDDQSAAYPAWSLDGEQIAYVGMPDATNAVTGGEEALAALQQRRIWLVDKDAGEQIQLTGMDADEETEYRDEAPQWVDNDTLLFARLDEEANLSLWMIDTDGSNLQQVVEEITPAPDEWGYYGYIDWSPIFTVWQPEMAEELKAQVTAQAMRPAAFPPEGYQGTSHALSSFLEQFHQELTMEEAIAVWGEPEMSSGSQDVRTGEQMITLQYALDGDLRIRLGFPKGEPLTFIQVQDLNGHVFSVIPQGLFDSLAERAGVSAPPALFGTATPHPRPSPTPTPPYSPLVTPTPK